MLLFINIILLISCNFCYCETLINNTTNTKENPNNGKLSISLGNINDVINVKVLNVSGQLISSGIFNSTDKFDLEINAAPGYYFIEITISDETKSIKVLKQ